jgi:hypothetical protein
MVRPRDFRPRAAASAMLALALALAACQPRTNPPIQISFARGPNGGPLLLRCRDLRDAGTADDFALVDLALGAQNLSMVVDFFEVSLLESDRSTVGEHCLTHCCRRHRQRACVPLTPPPAGIADAAETARLVTMSVQTSDASVAAPSIQGIVRVAFTTEPCATFVDPVTHASRDAWLNPNSLVGCGISGSVQFNGYPLPLEVDRSVERVTIMGVTMDICTRTSVVACANGFEIAASTRCDAGTSP